MFRNWITTLCGIAAATPLVVDGITHFDWKKIASGLAIAAMGALAKDANKTGAGGIVR
jgi:hypothetical protein